MLEGYKTENINAGLCMWSQRESYRTAIAQNRGNYTLLAALTRKLTPLVLSNTVNS